jgi:hypothetical protein
MHLFTRRDTNTDSSTKTASDMTIARVAHTATLIPDSTVLIAGGTTSSRSPVELKTAEIYDPKIGLFTATSDINDYRANSTATLISGSGTSVVAG